jgi:hypothetical protein
MNTECRLLFINLVEPPDVREQALIREPALRAGHDLKLFPSYGENAGMYPLLSFGFSGTCIACRENLWLQ